MFYYVYKMIHVPTGRVYIGRHRLQKGQTPETDGYHGSGKLWMRIYKAHPEECLKVVLEVVEDKETADALEKKFIAHYKSLMGELCMNIQDGGGGNGGGTYKLSEDTKQKMSESHRGKKGTMLGKHHSEAAKRKIAESRMGEKHPFFGKHLSEATRKKMSDAHKGRTPWNKGKKMSEATRKKMSESAKNRTRLK